MGVTVAADGWHALSYYADHAEDNHIGVPAGAPPAPSLKFLPEIPEASLQNLHRCILDSGNS